MALPTTPVPRWTSLEALSTSRDEDERPVLVAVERLGAMLRGQILSISTTHAEILPDDACHLFSKVNAQARFRCGETVHILNGTAISCESRRTIVMEFDKATRTNLATLRTVGMTPVTEDPCGCAKPKSRGKRPKADQKKVLHLPPPGGVERRIDPRFELESDAALYLLDTGHVIHCALLEISRSGCRLFSETPFELDADERVEVEFIGNGIPYRIAAMIRPKIDEHLTGLQFTDLTPRRRVQLDDLVGELRDKLESRREQ